MGIRTGGVRGIRGARVIRVDHDHGVISVLSNVKFVFPPLDSVSLFALNVLCVGNPSPFFKMFPTYSTLISHASNPLFKKKEKERRSELHWLMPPSPLPSTSLLSFIHSFIHPQMINFIGTPAAPL